MYVIDTSAIIERAVSKLANQNNIKGNIIIPNAVIAELENQANKGQEIGFLGLEEIQELQKLKNLKVSFAGERPTETQIKFAKSGEIDAYIRDIAFKRKATLVTADKVQAESAKAFGIKVMHIQLPQPKELTIEKYFDNNSMSVHLKEKCFPYAKKGKPGDWKLVKIDNKKLSKEEIRSIAKEIAEKARIDQDTLIEITRRSSTIIQYRNYRIVIVRPPVSDGWEITAVKPLKKLSVEDYDLPDTIKTRIEERARGIIIAGEAGAGKSTFSQALAELYLKKNKVVKTIESPRDLVLPEEITQYSKNFASSSEIHDILFLSRVDYIIFDEMRDTPDFQLYMDLRLAGSEVVGVLHSASPIDAVQRFISRMEVGMIPSVLDTIIFIEAGKVSKLYSLIITVKVPTGMTESDLARPVIEIKDVQSDKLEYEIYSYGEETVVIPIKKEEKIGARRLAEKTIENEIRRYASDVKVDVVSENKAIVHVPEKEIGAVIGKKGAIIDKIESKLNINLDIRPFTFEKSELDYNFKEKNNNIVFYVSNRGRLTDFYIDDEFLFSASASKKGEIKVHKNSDLGKKILEAFNNNKKIILKG